MKLLRKTVRRMILQESMITTDQLPEDVIILIREYGSSSAKIQYARNDPRQQRLIRTPSTVKDGCWGTILIKKGINGIPVWQVSSSTAGEGYGPLLYDIAMEYATKNGLGLMSDRSSVSDGDEGAVNVWDYYLENRDGNDVTAHQMDDQANTLTDTFDDNVNQHIPKQFAQQHTKRYVQHWSDHSTSKRYTKAPTTLEALGNRVIYV